MSKTVVKEHRVGKFYVGADLLSGLSDEEIKNLFDGFLIVRAEMMYDRYSIEYIAYHRDFACVIDGESIPEYKINFSMDDDGNVVRTAIRWSDGN